MQVFVGGIGLSLGAVGRLRDPDARGPCLSETLAGVARASGSLLPTGCWQPRDNTVDSELWRAFQKTLAGEAAAYQAPPAGEASGLVLFGDSITERLRGTSLGQPKQEALDDGLQGMVNATFRTRWPVLQLHGVSGDVAEPDLLWRITQGGELGGIRGLGGDLGGQ